MTAAYGALSLRQAELSSRRDRGARHEVVIALNEGRVVADVLTSIADAYVEFDKMKAFADLRDVPGFKNLSSDYVASDGTWVSHKLSFRCMGYNTAQGKEARAAANVGGFVDQFTLA